MEKKVPNYNASENSDWPARSHESGNRGICLGVQRLADRILHGVRPAELPNSAIYSGPLDPYLSYQSCG